MPQFLQRGLAPLWLRRRTPQTPARQWSIRPANRDAENHARVHDLLLSATTLPLAASIVANITITKCFLEFLHAFEGHFSILKRQ